MLIVYSDKNAEKKSSPYEARNHARPRAYIALLSRGPRNSIERKFLPRKKVSAGKWRVEVNHRPGDIYEIRRWWWDSLRETYLGGCVWIGFDQNNAPFALTRDEAFLNVLAERIASDRSAAPNIPAQIIATRMLPEGVIFQ